MLGRELFYRPDGVRGELIEGVRKGLVKEKRCGGVVCDCEQGGGAGEFITKTGYILAKW